MGVMTHHGINPWRFGWSLVLLLPAIFCLFTPFFHVCFFMWIYKSLFCLYVFDLFL